MIPVVHRPLFRLEGGWTRDQWRLQVLEQVLQVLEQVLEQVRPVLE